MQERRKVLIIDDEIDLCLLLKSYFVRRNYDVYLSHTMHEGISFLRSLKPNIVFLDNNLPDGVGWEAAPQLATEFPDMFICLISAFHPVMPVMPPHSRYSLIEKPISLTDLDRYLPEKELQQTKSK